MNAQIEENRSGEEATAPNESAAPAPLHEPAEMRYRVMLINGRRPQRTSAPPSQPYGNAYHRVIPVEPRFQSLVTKPQMELSDNHQPEWNRARKESSESVPNTLHQSRVGQWWGKMCLRSWLTLVSLLVAFRAIIVRMGFVCFTCTAIVTVVTEKKDGRFWFLCITIIPLLIDLSWAIKTQMERRENGNTISKWFSLCNFAYLICACPPIWIIELHRMDQLNNATVAFKQQLNQTLMMTTTTPTMTTASTTPVWLLLLQESLPHNESMMIMGEEIEEYIRAHEFINRPSTTRLKRTRRSIDQLAALQLQNFSLTQRIRILEQLLLLSVIVGRWLMPREGLSRDQLSQLLLINIGTAADILELFEAFSEEEVRQNDFLRAVILCLWQASLLQFCFNKTALRTPRVNQTLIVASSSRGSMKSFTARQSTVSKKSVHDVSHPTHLQNAEVTRWREGTSYGRRISSKETLNPEEGSASGYDDVEAQKVCCAKYPCPGVVEFLYRQRPCLCCETELWAIGMSLMLQDFPFLCLRLTLIIYFNVRSYSNVFFTCKNTLLIMLQIFRSGVIVAEAYSHRNDVPQPYVRRRWNTRG
ncbi:unnamed protein product [Dicrocoelium dendriticum]|nr:unnamed protein product [Dicrocoelium dendriticum]